MNRPEKKPVEYISSFVFYEQTSCNLGLDKETIIELEGYRLKEIREILSQMKALEKRAFENWLTENVSFQTNHSALRRLIPNKKIELIKKIHVRYMQSIIGLPSEDDASSFAGYCCKNFATVIVEESNQLLIYNAGEGVYQDGEKALNYIILYLLNNFSVSKWNNSTVKEVLNRIRANTSMISIKALNTQGLAFGNRTLDLRVTPPVFVEHSPKFYLTRKSEVLVDPGAVPTNFIRFLEEIIPEEKKFIQEWGGYMLESSNKAQKFLIAFGNGRNGKSVLFDMISKVLGNGNISALSMSALSGRFGREHLLGKLANISNEGATFDYSSDILKSLTSDELVSIDRKNKPEITAILTTKLVFITNTLPPIKDTSFGYERRLLLLEFTKTISESQVDPYLPEKLSEELSGILNFFLEGLIRLKDNNYRFSESEGMEKAKKEYFSQVNPLELFIESCFEKCNSQRSYRNDIFQDYKIWLQLNGLSDSNATNAQLFWKAFKNEFIKIFGEEPLFRKNATGRFLEGFSFNAEGEKHNE